MIEDPRSSLPLLGAVVATTAAFPSAALLALVYGFPVPLAGKLQGLDAMVPAMYAVLFYGVMGGFLVLPLLGTLAGVIADRSSKDASAAQFRTVMAALAIALGCAVLLATLDLLIGPW
jgi:cytochrome c biogenesis factor